MSATEAQALLPDLATYDAEPQEDEAGLGRLAAWALRRYSPVVAADPPDGLVLDVTGAVHLHGGEAALLNDIVVRLAKVKVAARAAMASTRDRLEKLVPIEPAAMADRQVIEWDKDDIDALKFMKVDCLALGMLSCMKRGLDLLAEHKGISHDLASIPPECPRTYAMIRRADTLGTCQIESRAQMAMLPSINRHRQPRRLADYLRGQPPHRPCSRHARRRGSCAARGRGRPRRGAQAY